MFYLLRQEETLKMAVKLESVHPVRTRYLVVVSRTGARGEESCLLGIDCNEQTTVGLVLKVLADTSITLDGDGGFGVSVCGRHHIFKPVSVQAMWSALQTLHKVSSKAREQNYFQGGLTHSWVGYYEDRIKSERSCLNEWNAMDNLESRRPPSPDSVRTKPTEREDTKRVIRSTLKEIMMSVDLDEVTSKHIRSRLEEDLNMDLGEFKSFIDQEMLTILGQMDAPTEIFDHVYLGSEWNASNYEELQRNGVGHILNVTREIDNFFPGTFDYLNIRVYDDEKTDLLKYWDDTFKYISKARKKGSKVLVHCKMGVSRSASVVIAYAMKAYNLKFDKAMEYVKDKRSCIKPNTNFLSQLETYQGILDAMKNKEKLQRSKSETNLKSPGLVAKNNRILAGSEPTPIVQANENGSRMAMSGQDLCRLGARPKSWSPDNADTNAIVNEIKTSPFRSMENLNQNSSSSRESLRSTPKKAVLLKDLARNVLLPCDNGESYSVSPNQIMHIENESSLASVKDRVTELEARKRDKKKLVLNLLPQFECSKADAGRKLEPWDPGESKVSGKDDDGDNGTIINNCDLKTSASDEETIQTVVVGSTVPEVRLRGRRSGKDGDPFSNQVDRVFDREERRQQRVTIIPVSETSEDQRECPSRQSSWSSVDSAVVLGFQGETREAPSRHSSWGSGDTRMSRNSSWSSYDMRAVKNDLSNDGRMFGFDKEMPLYPGTVRRTKQKLEESSDAAGKLKTSNETLQEFPVEALNTVLIEGSSVGVNIVTSAIARKEDPEARLSMSAPERSSSMDLLAKDDSAISRSVSDISPKIICTAQCSSVKQHKTYLENMHRDMNKRDDPLDLEPKTGIVKNRKLEFERVNQMNRNNAEEERKNKMNSLPSSPSAGLTNSSDKAISSSDLREEKNFQELLGKFQNHPDNQINVKTYKTTKYTTPLISTFDKSIDGAVKRPPMAPVVKSPSPNVVAFAKAVTKKQQQYGKTHPLAMININAKNNPVYNTM
ncbi:PREDICTED: protein phosphatase Slingshot isoform X3 [Nicrophorus vespilloides]|uniref:protein-serine/threonine phosphatase n=1 Tax=Nicrophorus vespilloides TaxID=110193 RepID=A0ABM1N608_NICVS|nr:PREDICTED: protein phosphatase Slingshot isoform X3 [Nicrophorus vespilloides]